MPEIRVAGIRISLCLAGILMAVPAPDARSDDDQGQYAVRGAGLIGCGLFVQAREAQDNAYLVTAAWIDGYVTGTNQHAAETYDVLSFESTELLLAILDRHCRENPADPVFGVLTRLFAQLWPDRVTERSDKIALAVDGREVRHYVELVERVQRELRSAGFYDGPISGEFSAGTVEAVERFQESIGFNATGFPDQTTLWRLLRRESP